MIDKYLRVGGVGKYNSRRTGGEGGEGGGTADQTKESTGRHSSGNRKKIRAAKQKELMPPRAGELWASMWRRLRPAVTGSIKKYAVVVPVAVVCRLTRRGYDVRHRGARKTPEG